MRKILLSVLVAVALVAGGVGMAPAEAKQPPPRCHLVSVVTTHEFRDVTHKMLGYKFGEDGIWLRIGNGIQERTVTTTTKRCRGKLSRSSTATSWKYLPGQGPDILVRPPSDDDQQECTACSGGNAPIGS